MTTTMTERDKKLLAGLGVVCVAVALMAFAIMPIFMSTRSMKQQYDENEIRIAQMQDKELQLPVVNQQNQQNHERLNENQAELYPILKTQDVDKLLTEKVLSHGMAARKLQIAMPEAAASVTSFGQADAAGSNPDGADGIWIAQVSLETSGSDGQMDSLIDDLSTQTPGVQVVSITWSKDRRTVDQASGQTEQVGVLSMQLQVLMSRKD